MPWQSDARHGVGIATSSGAVPGLSFVDFFEEDGWRRLTFRENYYREIMSMTHGPEAAPLNDINS
jgi:hypothetical protein